MNFLRRLFESSEQRERRLLTETTSCKYCEDESQPARHCVIASPFMLPYHGYPGHFQNFTRDGLQHLLRDFSSIEVRTNYGPMTAWVNMTAETFAVLIAGPRGTAYILAKAAALLPIFWLKYLDAIFGRMERSHRIAGMLCAVAVK